MIFCDEIEKYFKLFSGLLTFFVGIAIISTIYDVHQRFNLKIGKWPHIIYDYYNLNCKKFSDKPHPLIISFSIYTNGKSLLQVTNSAGQLKPLHGIRFLSMCWVVLLHAYMIVWLNGPTINLFDLGKVRIYL